MQKMIRPAGFARALKGKAFACAVLLAVAGCSPAAPKTGSPEALLNAEGEWKLVEEERAPNPEQKHMDSRAKVNPKKNSAGYTENAKLAHVEEDVHFRVLRLERQMKTLRSDFDRILPPLAESAKAGRSLESALAGIETASGEEADASAQVLAEIAAEPVAEPAAFAPPPVAADPAPEKRAPEKKPQKTAEKTPAIPAGAAQVTGLRTGEHPGRTRLVLDVSAAAKFSADLDPKENLLVVELPSAFWTAPESRTFSGHGLLKSYTAQPAGEGTRLVIEMKGPAKLAGKSILPPGGPDGRHRIVLDVAPL